MLLTPKQLLRRVDSWLARTGTSASRLGREVSNDPSLIDDMRNGREPRRATIDKLLRFMRDNPEGADEEEALSATG